MSVTYTAALPVREQTALYLSGLLRAERARRGTRGGTRALGCFKQAVLVLRWFLDGTRVAQLAADNGISTSTCYDYLHEGTGVLAAQAPRLESALLAAKMAGYSYVTIDGTVMETDRCRTPGPTPGVDLWWSAKCDNHGGNIQVITAPDGWPLWTSQVRPGREHDTTAVREHVEILPLLQVWTAQHLRVLGDLGYEGEAGLITVAYKKTQARQAHRHREDIQQGPQRCTCHRRTRELPAQGHVQGATKRQLVSLEDRNDRRSRAGAPPHRTRPHHMITQRHPMLARKGSVSLPSRWLLVGVPSQYSHGGFVRRQRPYGTPVTCCPLVEQHSMEGAYLGRFGQGKEGILSRVLTNLVGVPPRQQGSFEQ
jgi:hypothetical protein